MTDLKTRQRLRQGLGCLAVAAALLGGVPASVHAVDAMDYAVWQFAGPGPSGIGVIRDGASTTSLITELVSLRADSAYRLVGTTSPCGLPFQSVEVAFRAAFRSNEDGASFVRKSFDSVDVGALDSVRLIRGRHEIGCATALPYQVGGTPESRPHESFSVISHGAMRALVLVNLGSGDDTLTIVGHGFMNSAEYRGRGMSTACRSASPAIVLENVYVTNLRGIVDVEDATTTVGPDIRSFELNAGGQRVACASATPLVPAGS